mgnify:CR=1 FL=1
MQMEAGVVRLTSNTRYFNGPEKLEERCRGAHAAAAITLESRRLDASLILFVWGWGDLFEFG